MKNAVGKSTHLNLVPTMFYYFILIVKNWIIPLAGISSVPLTMSSLKRLLLAYPNTGDGIASKMKMITLYLHSTNMLRLELLQCIDNTAV